MRVIFLYVGQGESTFVLAPDGNGKHLSMLIDCNRAPSQSGIDIAAFLVDVLGAKGKTVDGKPTLDVFVNTHPHSDHLGGLDKIRDAVVIQDVWHSGHRPGREHDGAYQELQKLLNEVKKRGGKEITLLGSRTPQSWGLADVHVLSPAEYIVDEIADEKPADRYKRIHDQCAVLRIGYGANSPKTGVLITGDSDKTAWQRITSYHGTKEQNRIASQVLSASHHGSYTFFKDRQDDQEPYTAHLVAINPDYVIISAPDQDDSKHHHPDDEAVERYEAIVGKENVLHMGTRAWSFIVDIQPNGTYTITSDRGELAGAFPLEGSNSGPDSEGNGGNKGSGFGIISRVENSRPMGTLD